MGEHGDDIEVGIVGADAGMDPRVKNNVAVCGMSHETDAMQGYTDDISGFSTMSECAASGECFICMDGESAPPSPCICRGRYLHTKCQLRMAKQSGHGRCSVCKASYANLTIEVYRRVRLSTPSRLILSMLTLSSALVVASVYLLPAYSAGEVQCCLVAMCWTMAFTATLALLTAYKAWRIARRELGVATWMWKTHTCVVPSILRNTTNSSVQPPTPARMLVTRTLEQPTAEVVQPVAEVEQQLPA